MESSPLTGRKHEVSDPNLMFQVFSESRSLKRCSIPGSLD